MQVGVYDAFAEKLAATVADLTVGNGADAGLAFGPLINPAANGTKFGLASYFYSREIARDERVSETFEYGIVAVNTGYVATTEAPLGGVKTSGLGRKGVRQGLDDFMEVKHICMGGIEDV